MTIQPLHLLLPIVLALAFFNWGAALLLWLAGWWLGYVLWGGLRVPLLLVPLLRDVGVEPPPRIPDDDGAV